MSKQVGQDMNWCDPEAEWEKRNFDPPPREQVIVVNGVSDFPAGFGGTSPKGKHQGEFK